MMGTLASVWGRKRELFTESHNSPRPKNVRQVNSKVKNMLIIFFDINEIVHKKKIFLAGQTVNSAYYCGALRQLCGNAPRLCPKLWRQNNWLLHHDNAPFHTYFFTREFLTRNNMTVITHPLYFYLFP
jgi:hypothetical protein